MPKFAANNAVAVVKPTLPNDFKKIKLKNRI